MPIQSIVTDRRGFTLIEIIVTIVISSVLAVILAQVISNQTARSYAPVQNLDGNLALRAVMENITADHRLLVNSDPDPLATLSTRIDAGRYWDTAAITNGVSITAIDNGCITLDAASGETDAACTVADTLLKVTLTVSTNTGHRLTALFAR